MRKTLATTALALAALTATAVPAHAAPARYVPVPATSAAFVDDTGVKVVPVADDCHAVVKVRRHVLVFAEYGRDAQGHRAPVAHCEGETIARTFTIIPGAEDWSEGYVVA